jgi:hypothetical protein
MNGFDFRVSFFAQPQSKHEDQIPHSGVSQPQAVNYQAGAKLALGYGCSLHHSGHLTFWGVRVASTIIR